MADGFLGRWSRRKQDVRAGKPVAEPAPPAAPVAAPVQNAAPADASGSAPGQLPAGSDSVPAAEAPPPPTLTDAQALTPASDFKPFVARSVPPEVRNLAMKKLFADPHFNVMDGLDIYVGDYTQPDPLPAGMLRKMASAHALGFFDHEKPPKAEPVPAAADASMEVPGGQDGMPAIAPAGTRHGDDAEEAGAADVAQSQVCHANLDASFSKPGEPIASAPQAGALPASPIENDQDASVRLQPDDAPQRQGVGRGTS